MVTIFEPFKLLIRQEIEVFPTPSKLLKLYATEGMDEKLCANGQGAVFWQAITELIPDTKYSIFCSLLD